MTRAPALLVVAGATATGKSGLAIRVALALRSEGVQARIISADSRQVFRGLDIGTAKVPAGERQGIPHHGLDLVDPDENFSVAAFASHVAGVLASIAADGGLAILAGGTGFYLRAIVRGLDVEALPSDAAARRDIEEDILANGLESAASRLRSLAPTRAGRVDLRNPRRVARALEIAVLRGDDPLPAPRDYNGPVSWLGLAADPGTHESWISERAQAQFDGGLLEEARGLRERYDPGLPAFSAMGYREAWAVLDGGLSSEEGVSEIVRRTVAFAKRQRTWFRREGTIEWIDPEDRALDDRALAVAHALLDEARGRS
ncbi:MAG: tRNA (adenosine(37)-N6)-dimethylallyltransferase MiaA [Chloroflexota bacterium]